MRMFLLFCIPCVYTWALCAINGEYCHINLSDLHLDENTTIIDHAYVLVRYGADGMWSYRTFKGLNAVYCHSSNFGNVPASNSRMCYYTYPGNYTYDSRYITLSIGEYVPYEYNTVNRMDYSNGILTTNVMGRVKCNTELFYQQPTDYSAGAIQTHSNNHCRYYPQNLTGEYTQWKICATEGKPCYLPNRFNIYSIAFGSGGAESEQLNSYNAVIIREYSGEYVMCDISFFPNIGVYDNTYPDNPRVCLYAINKQFTDMRGYWNQVAACRNCKVQETLTIGVSSMNSNATSKSWTESFTKSTTNGVKFGFFSNSETMSKQQSNTVLESSSQALTQIASKSFSASCGGDVGQVYMWQWVLSADENCAGDVFCKTKVFTTTFLCRSTFGPPKCIPSECADDECEVCVVNAYM